MSTISFAVEPMRDRPGTVQVVPVVDGTALTDLIDAFERDARMEARAGSYGGLVPAFFKFGPARVHFTAGRGAFLSTSGKVPLLGCACGDWGCRPLLARVAVTATEVRWSDFEQPSRAEHYSAFGPFVFDRPSYDHALETLATVWDEQ